MHFKPVHGNRYELKETSEDLAQKFRSKKQTWRKASLKLDLISPPVEPTTYSCRSATTEFGPEGVKSLPLSYRQIQTEQNTKLSRSISA